MKYSKQVEIVKQYGFKFDCISTRMAPLYSFGHEEDRELIKLVKSNTKAKLIKDIEEVIAAVTKNEQREKERKAKRRRSLMQCISGGMAWAPIGIKTGMPIGKLKLVA